MTGNGIFSDRLEGKANSPSDALNDPRPKILLSGDDRLLSDVAAEVGKHLAEHLYLHGGEVTTVDDSSIHPVSAQQFRSLIEKYCVPLKQRSGRGNVFEIGCSMSESEARGILASHQFREPLRVLRRLNSFRLPVMRHDRRIELLPYGYDRETATLTMADSEYDVEMSFDAAQNVLSDLFDEFRFVDARSQAVAVSGLVGLYCAGLLPEGSLRPCFFITGNAEGCGKGTLAACCVVPVLGHLRIATPPDDDAEMRKVLTSFLRQGQRVILFDNARHTIGGSALEAFCSAPTWQDRLLGENETITMPNEATVFVTSNGASCTPDMRRRMLFAELHLDAERAEDRQYRRPLSLPVLLEMSPRILGAIWALVRHWIAGGSPQPSRSHSAFPEWARIVGGIVEYANFGCPLAPSEVAIVADADGDMMRALVGAMNPNQLYASGDLAKLSRGLEIFPQLVGGREEEMKHSQRVAFGRLLTRYVDRTVGATRLLSTGRNHAKRYWVVLVEGGSVQSGQSEQSLSPQSRINTQNHLKEKQTAETARLHAGESNKAKQPRSIVEKGFESPSPMKPGALEPLPYGEYFTECLKSGERALSREQYETQSRVVDVVPQISGV
jgi:hypothetical protein